jgi:hypothetical protein
LGHRCKDQEKYFSVWDSFRSRINSGWIVGGFFLVTAGVALWLVVRQNSALAYGYLFLTVMAGGAFYSAALGDAVENRRHLVLFHLMFDCCLVWTVVYVSARAFSMAAGSTHGTPPARSLR